MSCLETYATLRVFSQFLSPPEVTDVLGLEPTSAVPLDSSSKYRNRREWHLWRWSTQTQSKSKDNLEHIGLITAAMSGKAAQLALLRTRGCQTDIFCYWISSGQGGPILDVPTLRAMAELGLEISWDMYFGEESEYSDETPTSSAEK